MRTPTRDEAIGLAKYVGQQALRIGGPAFFATAGAGSVVGTAFGCRELAADGIPVTVTCRVLHVTPQAYYKWRANPVSDGSGPTPTSSMPPGTSTPMTRCSATASSPTSWKRSTGSARARTGCTVCAAHTASSHQVVRDGRPPPHGWPCPQREPGQARSPG